MAIVPSFAVTWGQSMTLWICGLKKILWIIGCPNFIINFPNFGSLSEQLTSFTWESNFTGLIGLGYLVHAFICTSTNYSQGYRSWSSYRSVPPLCFYHPTSDLINKMSYRTCHLGVFSITNAKLFSLLSFLVCYQLELLILPVYVQLSTDKMKQNKKAIAAIVVLGVSSLSETVKTILRGMLPWKITESQRPLSRWLPSLCQATFPSLLLLY